ncbi:hypothetical protein V8E52_008582 [Russula decolorans]
MSQLSSSSSFQALFGAALQDYEDRTRINLVNHPLAKQLEECDSLDSIIAILREQAKGFCKVRGDTGKLMKSVKCSVDVLYILSISTVLGEGVGLSFPPAKAIFAGIAILLAAVKNSRASYDTLVELLASFENFLSRLRIYTGIPPTPILTDVLVKIIAELLYTLALATKHVKRGRFKKFLKNVRGENEMRYTTIKLLLGAASSRLMALPTCVDMVTPSPIRYEQLGHRSCRGRCETDGVADLLGPSGWPGLARCRRVKVLACPYRLRPFFNLSALRDRRCLKKRSLWTLRTVCEQDHYIEGLRRKSLIRFINTTYSSKPSALAEASSANHCASTVLRKMSVEDSVDLEATRFPVLLVGRRICNVYDKEGECEGECGGVRGDGHGQAIDAKHCSTVDTSEYRDVEGTIIAIPDIAEKGLVDTRSRSRLQAAIQGIGILSRLLVEYDAKNLPAHLRALVKTSVHSDRALGKLEAGFITDPFYTIDLMQGSVKSNALPEEAWATYTLTIHEAALRRLDRLTSDEGRATAAQTLEAVYGLVRHRLTSDEGRATAAQTLEAVYGLVRHRRVVLDGAKAPPVLVFACY